MKKKILLSLVTLFVASFLFVGVINNKFSDLKVRADEEVESYIEEAISTVSSYCNPDLYEEPYRTQLWDLIDEYISKINLSGDEDIVHYLINDFYGQADFILNAIGGSEDSLDEKKSKALNYIDDALIGTDVYYVFEREINEFVRDIKEGIKQAEDEETIDELIQEFDDKMSKYPTDIDVYLVQLKYDLVESFIDYIGVSMHEKNHYLPDEDVDGLIENFESELRHFNVYEKIMQAYNEATHFVDFLLSEESHLSNPGLEKNNTNTILIITCIAEGAIILTGAVFSVLYFSKKKKTI